MSKSKCARCGQTGHWARDCTNEPDARGRANIAAGKDKPKPASTLFVYGTPEETDSGPVAVRTGLDIGFCAPTWHLTDGPISYVTRPGEVPLCFPTDLAE